MAVLAAALFVSVGCASHRSQLPSTDLARAKLSELVDSEAARRLLADLLERQSRGPRLAAAAPTALDADDGGARAESATDRAALLDQARLRALALEVSMDYAALAFARALGADEWSRAVQETFDRALRDGVGHSEEVLRRPGAFPYTVLFAPAWLYHSHPESGADFARQRQVLDRLGIPHRLIPSAESASVEENAEIIATAVREATRDESNKLIVVSDSKSGAEVALALSRLLSPKETASVAAWINLAGALRGTPLADSGLRPPISWVVGALFWLTGHDLAGPASMTTTRSRARLDGARIPSSVAIVNLVAVPVSGTVGLNVYGGYKVLSRHGPNDGVVLLADTVWPGGANIVALGADHLLGPLQDDAHALAMLRAAEVALRLHRVRSSVEESSLTR